MEPPTEVERRNIEQVSTCPAAEHKTELSSIDRSTVVSLVRIEITPPFLDVAVIFGLAMLWTSINLSRFQCVLEKEYFCSSIPNAFPEGLTSLLFVVTKLGVINATVFSSPNLKSVTSLALPNSGITRIEPGAFLAFQSLTKLSLYQNSLTDVTGSWLLNPGRLENLTVAQNLISEIRPHTFSGFSNLSTLSLANNRIRRIAGGSFKDLSQLTFVDLSGNRLTTLTRETFSGQALLTVKLGGNPWNCSCDLRDFGLYLRELKNASQLEDAHSVLCRSPPSMEGVHVWNISDLNCSMDVPLSAFENGFHTVGLPALLACVAFISFVLSLVLIWILKRDRQVRPSKEAPGLTGCGPVASVTEPGNSSGKVGTTETGASLQSRMSKVRPKSAAAILLQREFHQCRQPNLCFSDANPEHLMPPYVSTNDHSSIGSEDFRDFMKLWYYHKLEKCREKDIPCSFLTKVQMEKSERKLPSEGEKQILPNNENLGAPEEDDKDHEGFENPEPFLYLSIATAAEEATDEDPPNDVIVQNSGNHFAPFEANIPVKRSLTWPYEEGLLGHGSNTLSVRDSFVMQFFLPLRAPGELAGAGNSKRDEKQPSGQLHAAASCSFPEPGVRDDCTPEINKGARLDLETESPFEREAVESVSVGESELDERLNGQREMQVCPRKDDLVCDGSVELNTEERVNSQGGLPFQQALEAGGNKGAHTCQSKIKGSEHPVVRKSKQSLTLESSQSRARREIQSSLPPSDRVSSTAPRREDALVESSECSYINLLYEVVENRGRWTRERWKQTHQTGALNNRLAKSK
ncbi:hypothetical protein lerEdw1_006795 [Lerista edwardsae]|nr:hypothetical protein lerEdw1_006795 [Lerista edwardsae]